MILTDDYTPRYVGDTANPLQVQFIDPQRVVYDLTGLTGSNIVLRLHNQASGATTVGSGTWAITDATNGLAQYAWNAADVAVAGMFDLIAIITFPNGPLHFNAKTLEIKPAL